MCHGTTDNLVLEPWAKDTFTNLSRLGVQGEYHLLPNVSHELDRKEFHKLYSWLLTKIPEKESSP